MQTRTNDRTRAPRGAPRAEPKTEAPAPEAKPDPHHAQHSILRAMRGRRVTLRLLDGTTIEGHLVADDTFTLVLRPDGAPVPADGSPPLPALIFKHGVIGVDWLE